MEIVRKMGRGRQINRERLIKESERQIGKERLVGRETGR